MNGKAKGMNVGLDDEARTKLDDYLKWVRKDLKEVDAGEKKAILQEIQEALNEKLEIIGGEKSAGTLNGAMMDRVLEDFGSPSEVAGEYSGVARAAIGRDLLLFMLLQAVFAGAVGIIGALLIKDDLDIMAKGWEIFPDGIIWGTFWIMILAFTLVSLGLQYRKRELVPELGPFTALTLLAAGLWGISTISLYRWQVAWIFGVEDYFQQNILLVVLALTLILATIWGVGRILKFIRKLRAGESGELVPGRRRFTRKSKVFIGAACIVLISLFIAGNYSTFFYPYTSGMPKAGDEYLIMSEDIGGPYNARLDLYDYYTGDCWQDAPKIVYNVSGKEVRAWFDLQTRPALDWIKNNTPENATIVAWWDHGNSIRGYTGRNCTIYYPSKNLLNTVGDPSSIKELEPAAKVRLTAEIYTAGNATELKDKMEQAGASYIFIAWRYSSSIAYALLQGAGKSEARYLDQDLARTHGRFLPSTEGESLFLFKAWKDGFEGTNVVYKDINTMIVEVA